MTSMFWISATLRCSTCLLHLGGRILTPLRLPCEGEVLSRRRLEAVPRRQELVPRRREVLLRRREVIPRRREVLPRQREVLLRRREVVLRQRVAVPLGGEVVGGEVVGGEVVGGEVVGGEVALGRGVVTGGGDDSIDGRPVFSRWA